ncbi:ABC transporter, partial [Bacillus cereus]
MLKIIKHLKPFIASIIAVVCLLTVQAVCDLSLPDYMSNIVNVGIQQKGVENAVPEVIRKSEMDKLTLFMNENEKKKVADNYVLLDKNDLSQSELKNDFKDYPQLDKEPLYKLHTEDKKIINELNDIFGKPMLITQGI